MNKKVIAAGMAMVLASMGLTACGDSGSKEAKDSSDETYTIGETEALKGVYNINKGYAMFRLIDILYEYGDYCIVSDKTDYGVTLYDHIILNGSSVKENDIIY